MNMNCVELMQSKFPSKFSESERIMKKKEIMLNSFFKTIKIGRLKNIEPNWVNLVSQVIWPYNQ